MVKIVAFATDEVLQQVSELCHEVWKSKDHSKKERILKHSSRL